MRLFIQLSPKKITLGMEFYEQNGRFILFISTILVLIYLIITLTRWVYTLSQLDRLGNTIGKIKDATEKSLDAYRLAPNMGATQLSPLKEDAVSLIAQGSGYLTHIDMSNLQRNAEPFDCKIHICVRPRELISPDSQLCLIEGMDNMDCLR